MKLRKYISSNYTRGKYFHTNNKILFERSDFMRLTRLIVNILQLVFVYIILCVVTFGTYTLMAYQADDESARFTFTNQDDRVWMLDNYAYWGTDIGSSFVNTELPQPKLRVALWFDWDWWRNSMSYVDMYVVNPVVSAVKPVVTPISCADEIKTYYGKNIADFADYINYGNDTVTKFESFALTYYDILIETENVVIDGNPRKIITQEELNKYANCFDLHTLVNQDMDNNGSKDIYDLADDYNYFYQLLYKLTRYNKTSEKYISEANPEGYVYYRWYNKFVIETADGDRTLATAVYALYTLNFVNIILALVYCWANWVVVNENDDGTLSPGRSIFSRMHRRKKKKKNKHKNKHKDEDDE